MLPVEYVSGNGIKLRTLFLGKGDWWKLFLKYHHLIRISIIVNVLKLLVCRTSFLGHHHFVCPTCAKSIKVPHSCKSRFCPSCGKKVTDIWIKNSFNTNMKANVEYLGKYLKHPPIGETRIKHYDGITVTYKSLDHYAKYQRNHDLASARLY